LNRAAFGHADRSRARCREIFGGAGLRGAAHGRR
jgi:hypothetical protein